MYGSIINGIFRGVIEDTKYGKLFIEENNVFFGKAANESVNKNSHKGHSVIYHENDVKFPRSRYVCFSHELH